MSGTSWHSSGAKVDTGALDKIAKDNYELVAQTIRANGWAHPTYPADIVLDYGTLRALLGDRLEGLGTILKNMKRAQMLDFHDAGIIRDDYEITCINDFYQEFHSAYMILYGDIQCAIQGDKSGHLKTGGW